MNKVDLLFIVDVTGSMSSLIQEAKEKMQNILNSLSEKFKIDLQVGLSLYRDHNDSDEFITAIFSLQTIDEIKSKIDILSVRGGGGDGGEAVIDGIVDGIQGMKWRDGSRRIAFLIGDEKPHGMLNEVCCECGKTWGEAVSQAEKEKVTIYAISLDNDSKLCFKILANFTGGVLIESSETMKVITETLNQEFDNLNLDSQILEMISKNMPEDEISKMLKIDREGLLESKSRIAQCL